MELLDHQTQYQSTKQGYRFGNTAKAVNGQYSCLATAQETQCIISCYQADMAASMWESGCANQVHTV